ncbi:TPA: hypothetical protein HA265_04930 [Candidatus Woesearchaeota archaeon]|nr:hypothetical protein [Candidatus Woesearchaeota archaeon]
MTQKETKANVPEKKFRAGAISATIWKNVHEKDGKSFEVRSIQFERAYKDKDSDEWKSTSSLRAMDLPKAVVVLNKAYEYLVMNNQAEA